VQGKGKIAHTMGGKILLLLLLALVTFSKCYVAIIDCTGKEGKVTTQEQWKCLEDGSAECSKNVEDCSEGEQSGRAFGGTTTFQAGGMITAKGEGWDCREMCRDGGEGGSRERTEEAACKSAEAEYPKFCIGFKIRKSRSEQLLLSGSGHSK